MTETQTRQKSRFIFLHPLLFVIWPVLALYDQNAKLFETDVLLQPIIAGLAAALVLCLTFRTFSKSWAAATLMASVFIIAYFDVWKPVVLDIVILQFQRYKLPPILFYGWYSVLIVVFIFLVRNRPAATRALTVIANVVALALIAYPSARILYSVAILHEDSIPVAAATPETSSEEPDIAYDTSSRPDVYFILLDAYPRADLLLDNFNFDNSEFLGELEKRGFVVAENSTSNYGFTKASVASMFNLNYLNKIDKDGKNFRNLTIKVRNSTVINAFNDMGYDIFTFPAGYSTFDIKDGPVTTLHRSADWSSLGEFGFSTLEFTPIPAILRSFGYNIAFDVWYGDLLYALNTLHDPPRQSHENPLCVIAHIVCPHPPYVMGPDGGPQYLDVPFSISDWDYKMSDERRIEIHNDQLQGLNIHVLKSIDNIFEKAQEPPVVILISDHADRIITSQVNRLRNLCALYLPGPGLEVPREVISNLTMVNLFRLIFNTYFGTQYDFLEKLDYFESLGLKIKAL